ncbi:MAG: glycosyltransferase family 39 protein [Candidatus Sumerlaeaceae bacterium]|nr:glycosyltransferase family 39 protein [Candidatus Sumerlaeaceae bacterium]
MTNRTKLKYCGYAIAGISAAFAFVTSYLAWRFSPHAVGLRDLYPSWYYGDAVIFDGYGPYSQWIAAVLVGREGAWYHLSEFIRHDYHSHTPLYPFLCALVILVVGNVVWAHLFVTLTASIMALGLFWRLLGLHFGGRPDPAVQLLVFCSFVFHPGVISCLARPMPDSLALALLLGVFYAFYRFVHTARRRWLWLAYVLILFAMLTKTVLILLAPTIVIWALWSRREAGNQRRLRRRLMHLALPVTLVCAGLIFLLWWSLRSTRAMAFVLAAVAHSVEALTQPKVFFSHAPAFALFLVIGFGLYPLFWRWPMGQIRQLRLAHGFHRVWLVMYLLQRVLFAGFNLAYGRARYTLPLAPSVVLEASDQLAQWWKDGGWRRVGALFPCLFHLAIWCAHLMSLLPLVRG